MRELAELLNQLYFTYSHLEKIALLKSYFARIPDPERGLSIAVIAGVLNFKYFKRTLIQELVEEFIDPILFRLSWDYVGDFSETVALLWPNQMPHFEQLPSIEEIVTTFSSSDKSAIKNYLLHLLNTASQNERWAIIKLGTGELRIGVSQRFLKQALAEYGGKEISEIEEVWHAVKPPYELLFAWLENTAPKPDLVNSVNFHPVMLSHPLDDKSLLKIHPDDFFAEWKYDGIRVQAVSTHAGRALFSRTGDDISKAFPDVILNMTFDAILDGELVVYHNDNLANFNDLQQRLNRKTPNKNLVITYPGHIIIYDALMLDQIDLRHEPLIKRRAILQTWFDVKKLKGFSLSPLVSFTDEASLKKLREDIMNSPHPSIEGLMLKRKTSPYLAGRPTGHWYKWKRDPFLVDAVLMYAQRGSGRRSSYYSDFTFGLWFEKQLLPIGKAYFGFTDEELYQLDKWVRTHTVKKFGPVREVAKELVLEIAFDAVQKSTRHKSGYALRFPRIHRIRWDKPALEADQMDVLAQLLNSLS
ncbi:MAG: cisplatin damage response ATP-dependent DNA ligase [Gammaproteobacteria bacterium]|nr:cisplatin damage response ATP-dependent DNA ligase [Gammaproteobacteria bacterium]